MEPLPNLPIVKDLVVDMAPFWNQYRKIKPYFDREWKDTIPESSQEPNDARLIEHLIYCILCGVCWACPINARRIPITLDRQFSERLLIYWGYPFFRRESE